MTDPIKYRAFKSILPLEYPPMLGHLEYSGWKDEQLSWKQSCYIGDWSFVPQIRIKGPDAVRLFADLSVNSFANAPIGKAKHCVMCNEDGKVITEGILMRHAEDDIEYQCGVPQWVLFKLKTGGYDAEASFPFTHKLQVSGPTALAVLEKLTQTTLRDVKFMETKVVPINGMDTTFLRQGMAGEIGFELHGPIQHHAEIYKAVYEAGLEFGIRRLGRRTVQINHLEACFPTTGIHYWNALADERRADYRKFMDENLPAEWHGTPLEGPMRYNFPTSYTGSWDGGAIEELYRSPVEMGWGKSIKFDHEFLGRSALEDEVAHPRRKLMTLEFNSDDLISIYASHFSEGPAYQLFEIPHAPYITNWTDWIIKDGKKIGHATHPGYSYFFRKGLALSFIDVEHSALGTEVTVLWGNPGDPQTEIRAKVAPAPYKQDDRRKDLGV